MTIVAEIEIAGARLRLPLTLGDESLAEIAAALQARGESGLTAAPYLTVKAAASYLGLSEHALRHQLARRAIPRHQAVEGGRILVARADLDAWLAEGRQ